MQLFVLDRDHRVAVRFLADIHLVKMCLETAQILSGVITCRNMSLPPDFPRIYAINHPVLKATQAPEQINWTVDYNIALQQEFHYRFGRKHAYFALSNRYYQILHDVSANADCQGLGRVFRDFQTTESDLILAHRAYYRFRMDHLKRPPAWSRRPLPKWLFSVIQ